ncbi:MAG TPA: 6,7-dimethyl-8-ribityllumazine synthase [Tepidisphaeraceae bacterium]|nr:6,7-dimethyl-8-ribityllumazine synthase [Tepidisphaeraceae bacterium]
MKAPAAIATRIPSSARVGVVAARFNAELVDELLKGCLQRLKELGIPAARVTVERVPGAFELPVAAQALCRTKRYGAVICLGAVVRGETPHFDFVAGECARGIARVGLDENMPVIFGVLTTNDDDQAWARAGGKHGHVGKQSAEAAVEMIGVLNRLRPKRRVRA